MQIFALLGVSSVSSSQFGHAHDAVHGGADFVAHVGQELAFGAAGRFGPFFHHGKFGGSSAHFLFQPIMMALKVLVALLNLGQHGVEAINEVAQFVFGVPLGADGIVLLGLDRVRGLREVDDRIGDQFLQFQSQEVSDKARKNDNGKKNSNRLGQRQTHLVQVGFEVYGSEKLPLHRHGVEYHEVIRL